tara:strand:- start:2561 stop:3658 length:1098 start_codon:yes stop_codon:yes gene_type:complete
MNVRIFGAGSIGNHLAHGCRGRGWDVTMTDLDPKALERTRTEIYPERYKAWDEGISLEVAEGSASAAGFDVAIIGTPPDSHFALAKDILSKDPPRVLLIEKPLATPDLKGCAELAELARESGTCVLVDYNHTATPNTQVAEQLIDEGKIGAPESLQVRWVEHWGGIYKAHPWLAGPSDTYLGFWKRGGGALGEHSHGVNIWQHFARKLGTGRVTEVMATIDFVSEGGADYDRLAQLQLRTESGLSGSVIQDVVTEPPIKNVRIQGADGFLDWYANYESGCDALVHGTAESQETKRFPKTRPDDFKGMIDQVAGYLDGTIPAHQMVSTLEHGLETMLVVAAAFRSNAEGRLVKIDYSQGFSARALS